MDEIAVEELAAHLEKMTRWAGDALDAALGIGFWVTILLSRRSRYWLDVFFYQLQKRRPMRSPTNLARMVWGKAWAIKAKLDALLDPVQAECTFGDIVWRVESEQKRRRLKNAVTRAALRMIANFHRRVITRLDEYPAKLLWFAAAPPDVPLRRRATIAGEILAYVPRAPAPALTVAEELLARVSKEGCDLRRNH